MPEQIQLMGISTLGGSLQPRGQVTKRTLTNDINLESFPDFLDDLSQWKDRTQAAATTSLSIVQIAILRDVIEGGPEKFRYYTAAIVILSVCLALEVFSGLLLITLFILRSKSRMLSNTGTRWQNSPTPQQTSSTDSEVDTRDGPRGHFARSILYLNDIEKLLDDPSILEEQLDKYPSKCCGCWRPSLDVLLREAIDLYDRKVTATRLKHASLPENISQEADAELQKIIIKREILKEYLTNINSRLAYNRIVNLQTVITYLFYIISLLNIFVAVFGVNQNPAMPNVTTSCF